MGGSLRQSRKAEGKVGFGVDQARQRVMDAMRSGKWDVVETQLGAYAAAVRAEERHRAIGEALEALKDCGGDEGARPVRDCLAAVERLR
jgi:hypothetical protein